MPSDTFLNLPAAGMESAIAHLPADFLPAGVDKISWRQGENGWIIGVGDNPPEDVHLPGSLTGLHTPDDLPAGTVLVRPVSANLRFAAPVPFGADIHWLKEAAEGVLQGSTGIRVQSVGSVVLRGEFGGEWIAAARREEVNGTPGLRVALWRRADAGLAADAGIRWNAGVEPKSAANAREIVSALLGIHPLNWVRGLLNDLGSRRAEEFARAAGGSLRALDAVRGLWESLSGGAEAALWQLVSDPAHWKQFRGFLDAALHVEDASRLTERVLNALPASATSADRSIADWILAVIRSAGITLDAPEAASIVSGAARKIKAALDVDGVEQLLLALPRVSADEVKASAPGAWARNRLEELFGIGLNMAEQALRGAWDGIANRIAAAASQAVQRQWELRAAAGFSTAGMEQAVADATFQFDEAGLAAAGRVCDGDLDPVFAGASLLRLRRGLITDTFVRRCFAEVQLPFLRLRRKQKDLASVASAEASVTEDGRVQVNYRAETADILTTDFRNQTAMILSTALSVRDGEAVRDHFVLSFSDRRPLEQAGFRAAYRRVLQLYGLPDVPAPGRPCTAHLTLRLPGSLAEAWLKCPLPGTPAYMPAMASAASAVQAMAREWLPALYLASPDAYTRPSAVHPLLAWSCSPPSSGPRKKDLTYDFMDPKVLDDVLQACAPAFRERLAIIHQMLFEDGRRQTASYYEPADTRYILANVRRQQRNLVSLLAADAFLVESVLHLAECARELDRLARTTPRAAVGELARFTREVAETFHRKLRRLYAGDDFLALGPLFFLSATSALASEWGDIARIAAVLTLEFEDGRKEVVSNQAAQRLF